jgi:hypothetical protein
VTAGVAVVVQTDDGIQYTNKTKRFESVTANLCCTCMDTSTVSPEPRQQVKLLKLILLQ